MNKAELRIAQQKLRGQIAVIEAQTAAGHIVSHFFETLPVKQGAIIAGYWPIRTELDVRPLLKEAAARGHKTALPVMVDEFLHFCLWQEGDDMVKDTQLGVPEPADKTRVVTPGIILVPLLAYDAQGYRLGYGKGYYDRAIPSIRQENPDLVVVGVGYASQNVENLPREDHDQPVDWMLTEKAAVPYS